jgi:hypothetical protein
MDGEELLNNPNATIIDTKVKPSTKIDKDTKEIKIVINENNNCKDNLTNEYLKYAIEKIDNPFRNLTVKDVAEDLKMGEAMTNDLFRRDDFPSVNIGKTKTITLLAYLRWKMERRN